MPVNSSATDFLPLVCSFNSSHSYPDIFKCFNSTINTIIYNILTFTTLFLLLPLYILILWMGFHRWRSATGPTSHSDVFTYCMVTMEMFNVLGLVVFSYANYTCSSLMMVVGYYCFCTGYPAQTFFHCLTCMERYLAVVHPVTYMGLKQAQGVRIRNIGIGCVCLLCFGMSGFAALDFPVFPSGVYFFFFAVTLLVVCFCSLSVFCALTRPGVGNDQSKRRAFNTIIAITGTLVLRFAGLLAAMIVFSEPESGINRCMMLFSTGWMCIPSSLVLPLLFLHRSGTLVCSSRSLKQSEN